MQHSGSKRDIVDDQDTRTDDERRVAAMDEDMPEEVTAGARAAKGEAPEGAAAAGTPDALAPELEALQRELSTLNDRHLRLAAEFDNYRKRNERERAELYARAQGDLVRKLLDAIDDLERVGDFTDSSAGAILEGVQLVEKKLMHSLGAAGLETIDPAGDMFDPTSMEAVGVVPTESAQQDGRVADVFQKGYRFGGHLIRAARVRVHQHEG